jgi:Sensors of blue-light using FAD
MTELHALVYVSTANHMLSLAEIEHILQGAHARNPSEQVTGMLLYDSGNFMQYLEGPVLGLSKIYDIIKNASLHHGLVELLRWPISKREFPHWSMAFRSTHAMGSTLPKKMDSPSILDWLKKPTDPESVAGVLLTHFWWRSQMPHGVGVYF